MHVGKVTVAEWLGASGGVKKATAKAFPLRWLPGWGREALVSCRGDSTLVMGDGWWDQSPGPLGKARCGFSTLEVLGTFMSRDTRK